MQPLQFEQWALDFRANSRTLNSASGDTSGEVAFAIQLLRQALPQLCASQPRQFWASPVAAADKGLAGHPAGRSTLTGA